MRINWVQASAIMDTIAENICHITHYMDSCDYGIEDFTEGVNTLTRDSFIKICKILDINEVKTEDEQQFAFGPGRAALVR